MKEVFDRIGKDTLDYDADCFCVQVLVSQQSPDIAQGVVRAGFAERCEVQISYVIGVADPVSIHVETFGTESQEQDFIEDYIKGNYDLTPQGIIEGLNLLDVDYNQVSLGEYESNIKFSNILKSSYVFNFFNYFNILFSNEFIVKKSFVFHKKVKYNHVFSNYHIKSKITDMNIEQKNNEINNGNNFYIQNISFLRFFDLPILRHFELTKKIMPYFSLESFFIPRKSSNFKDFFKLIYNAGVSFQIKENLFVDFSFFTGTSKNISIKKKHINSFRIKLST